jgi:uncharacterized protein (TIGR03067 family)
MRKTTIAALALCAVAAVAGRADDAEPPADVKAELKKLRGAWTISRAIPAERKPSFKVTYTFDGGELKRVIYQTAKDEGGKGRRTVFTYKVKIDTKAKPPKIKLTRTGARAGGAGLAGVYKLEKGELFLALGEGRSPAKDFRGEAEGVRVYMMTREKAEEKKGKEKAKE